MTPAPLPILSGSKRTAVVAVAVAVLLAAPTSAQLPHARLDSVFPPGGKSGTQVEIEVRGVDLDNVDRLIFSHDGLSAEPKTEQPSELFPDTRPVPGVFVVTIADRVSPGLYEVRAIGHFGISNPRWFHVDAQHSVQETADNTDAGKAMSVPVGTTVSGRADGDRIDYFRFAAKAGERLTIERLAEQIDSRMDATFALYDPTGQEVARVRDTRGRDPVLALTTRTDGEYTLAVYDFLYRGGNDYFYRLSLHRNPHLTQVFPPCVLPGSRTSVTLYGYNLPGGKPVRAAAPGHAAFEQLNVELDMPPQAELLVDHQPGVSLPLCCSMLDGWLYQLDSPTGPSNRLLIGCARAPVIAEREPNNNPQQATAVTLPCDFVGRLSTRSDRDWVSFTARKGQVLWIEAISHRLGAPCDPVLHIERVSVNSQGQQQVARITDLDDTDPPASNDPSQLLRTRSDDPAYRLVVDRDAAYRVQIRDLYGSPRAGSQMVYRLTIQEQQPDFRLLACPLPSDRRDRNKILASSSVLRPGGTTAFEVRCFRQRGFDGEVEISVEGLPAGVSCAGARLGGEVDAAGLVFTATEDAAAWAGTVRFVGRATIDGRQVERTARTAAVVLASDNLRERNWRARLTQQTGLSVMNSDNAPALVTIGDGIALETSVGGRLEVPIQVVRRKEFAPAGNPVAQGLPKEVQIKASPLGGTEGKLELNLGNTQIRPGTYTFYLRAPVKQKRERNPTAIAAAEAEAKRWEQVVTQKSKQAGEVTEAEKVRAEQILKEAQRLKSDADRRLNDARNNNKEREFTFELVSTPLQLRVHGTPLVISVTPGSVELRKGEKVPLSVSLERKFGFDDKVDVLLTPPPGVPGVTAQQISIAKGQSSGTMEIAANDQARPGEYDFHVVGRVRFNNVNLEEKHSLTIRVAGD